VTCDARRSPCGPYALKLPASALRNVAMPSFIGLPTRVNFAHLALQCEAARNILQD